MTLAARRAGVIAAALAVLVAVSLVDANVGRAPAASPSVAQPAATAVVPAGSGSSSWFCAGGSGSESGAEETVIITNPTPQTATGTVTAVPSSGGGKTVSVQVAPGAVTTLVPAQMAPGPWVSAVVLLDQAGIGVEETVSTPLGWSEAPCASSAAARWLFTGASTAGNDGATLSILNPSVTPAVVDTTLVTSGGQSLQPADYQGVTVAPGSLVTEYLSDHDESDPSISVSVTAVTGLVVAATLQSYTASGAEGVALDLGATQAAATWSFPDTEQIPGGRVAFHVYDPGRQAARVRMAVRFAEGTASPIEVTVGAGQSTTVEASAEPRVPVGTPFSVTFRSAGPGVVVTRDVQAPSGGGSPQRGLVLGAMAGARQWLVPPITAPGTNPWSFAVQNVSGRPVTVTVSAVSSQGTLVGVPGLSPVTVAPGQSEISSGSPPAPLGSVPLVVSASGPVTVELDPEPVGTPGVVEVPALPVG